MGHQPLKGLGPASAGPGARGSTTANPARFALAYPRRRPGANKSKTREPELEEEMSTKQVIFAHERGSVRPYIIEAWGRKPVHHHSTRTATWHLNALKRQGFDTDEAFKSLVAAALSEFDSIYATDGSTHAHNLDMALAIGSDREQ